MDSRFFRRRSIAIHFRVFDASTDSFIGRIGDISEGGILVYGPSRLKVRKLFRLRIDLPEQDGNPEAVTLDAKTMWSGMDVNPEFFCSGFRFVELHKPHNRAALDVLLSRFTITPEGDER
jgi:hypothetical protein